MCSFNGCLIKEINRLRKEITSVFSKGMSIIYLKVTVEMFSKLDLLSLENMSPGQFWGGSTHADATEF